MASIGSAFPNDHLFIVICSPVAQCGGKPIGSLAAAIDREFGGLENLKQLFVEESYPVFASGYVSLVKKLIPAALDTLEIAAVATGKVPAPAPGSASLRKKAKLDTLDVVATGDANNPLRLKLGVPIFPLDIWEHAYFLGELHSSFGSWPQKLEKSLSHFSFYSLAFYDMSVQITESTGRDISVEASILSTGSWRIAYMKEISHLYSKK